MVHCGEIVIDGEVCYLITTALYLKHFSKLFFSILLDACGHVTLTGLYSSNVSQVLNSVVLILRVRLIDLILE